MSGWFVPFKYNKNSYIRLFCFHYGGGSAEWAKDLIDYVDLIAIQLPGRESRFSEPLLDNISDIVNELSLNLITTLINFIFCLVTGPELIQKKFVNIMEFQII